MTTPICQRELCTGCGACVAVCPKKCIVLLPNPQGHLLPKMDEKACINCNLCRKTCPVNVPVPLNEPTACYAAWATDEKDRTTSSSGGVSSVCAAHCIDKGGVVYGAALENNKIQHIRVAFKQDLPRLKGSKYVYSYAVPVYPQIQQDLTAGKQVLFIGTPCQNAALYNIMGNNSNLTLVNLICHGVPSMQMLTDHLKTQNIKQIQKIQFRNNNNMYEFVCNNYKAYEHLLPDIYMTLFLNGVTYRQSCYTCTYAQPKRPGDITIGDFWGLGRTTPFEGGDTTKGCSVILINTDKGKVLLNACKDKLNLFKREYAEAVTGNDQLRGPVAPTKYVKQFNKLYPHMAFNKVVWIAAPLFIEIIVKKFIFNYFSPKIQQSCYQVYRCLKGGKK